MLKAHAEEAAPILNGTLDALLSWAPLSGRAGADLRSAIGDVRASTLRLLQNDELGPPLVQCFDLARDCGIGLSDIERVRQVAAGYSPVSVGAILVKDSLIELSLITASQVVAAMVFTSRKDVEEVKAVLNVGFSEIEEHVADQMDAMTYRAIITLHAAVSFYLIEVARPLPEMLAFRFNLPLPTLVAAQKLYYDAGRADQLRGENKVVHPLFMRPFGRALSF